MDRLRNKVAVVIGAASGIGRAVVDEFVREGAEVHAADIRPIDPAGPDGGPVRTSRLDASDPGQVDGYIGGTLAAAGRIDILVNSAGIHLPASVVDATPEEFDRLFDVNVKSVYLACHHVLPQMLERRRGSIVNVASNGGLIGRPGDPLYNASKHAVVGLTRSMAVAYAQLGIRVNAVCPGPVDTLMMRGTYTEEEFADLTPTFVASTPAARIATAREVAMSVLFLASDESPAITGAAVPVDGGKSAGVLGNDRYRTDIELNRSFD